MELIHQIGPAELSDWRTDIVRMADNFQRRRRKNILQAIDDAMGTQKKGDIEPASEPTEEYFLTSNASMVVDFRHALDELRDRHIYQWSTFYRDTLEEYFSKFFTEFKQTSRNETGDAFLDPLADHSCQIFSRGYEYVRANLSHDDAIQKSINGLSRFLELPLEFYSARSTSVFGYDSTFALRLLASAAVCGIIEGYAKVRFGQQGGEMILPRFQRTWLHYMAFLTPQHADRVIELLGSLELSDSLRTSVLPLLDVVQRFFDRTDEDYFPLPITGQFSWYQRRLDLTIRAPHDAESQRLIEANAFMDAKFVSPVDLNDAVGRQVSLIIAPLRPDVLKVVRTRKLLSELVVPSEKAPRDLVANEAFRVWDDTIFALRSKRRGSFPITYNFAREFPLRDQNKAQFFHVARTSVRDLLRTFERRNGARLWCSVRRSGKTTACFDLESAAGDSTIVPQTCGSTQTVGARVFFDRVADALESGKRLPASFVSNVVSECAPIEVKSRRVVLVIDEYETLFGLLKTKVNDKPSVQYSVVQPILDQLVAFSYENLLVLLGQQPDAHFILMEQNQLAPYVEQDAFPLFEHNVATTTGEFSELVRKIFAGRIDCASGFMDALFEETAGHPFLTVNVLGEFVDWLIEQQRPQVGLRVDEEDFEEFAATNLAKERLELSQDYEFFRNAAAEAMSERGYRSNPWLYTTYWILHLLSNKRGVHRFRSSIPDFRNLFKRIPVPANAGLPTWSEMLRSASQANFLAQDERGVSVKIRTLGRIASSVRPMIS